MLTMAVGHSDDVDPGDAIAAAIEECRAALGDQVPQAALLLSSFTGFDPTIVATVRAAFPGMTVMGSTSAAEMSSPGGYLEDSITLAVFASDEVDVTTGLGAGLGIDVDAACGSAAAEALAGTARDPMVCVVLTESFVVDPQRMIDALRAALPAGVLIVGGGASGLDFNTVAPSYQFRDDRIIEDGVAILLFSGPVAHSVAIGTGWHTLGERGTVTGAGTGYVAEIDGRPAADFIAPYLDVTGPASYGNPLAVLEAGANRSYLRAILGSDPATGAISLFGSVPIGSTVQLTTANTEDILAGTKDALARATAAFPAGARPEAALIFSCAVRRFLLGSRTNVEVAMARDEYGIGMPLAGLYCVGEIGPTEGAPTSRFLNETFVTLLLGT